MDDLKKAWLACSFTAHRLAMERIENPQHDFRLDLRSRRDGLNEPGRIVANPTPALCESRDCLPWVHQLPLDEAIGPRPHLVGGASAPPNAGRAQCAHDRNSDSKSVCYASRLRFLDPITSDHFWRVRSTALLSGASSTIERPVLQVSWRTRGGGFEPPSAFAHWISNPAPYRAGPSPQRWAPR